MNVEPHKGNNKAGEPRMTAPAPALRSVTDLEFLNALFEGMPFEQHAMLVGFEGDPDTNWRGRVDPWKPGDRLPARLGAKAHGWLAVTGYADPAAGERGVVYQACGWLHLGIAPGSASSDEFRLVSPDGRVLSDRALRRRAALFGTAVTWPRLRRAGWTRQRVSAKRLYTYILPNARAALLPTLKYAAQPSPRKREERHHGNR